MLKDEYVLVFGGGKKEYSVLRYKRLLRELRVLMFPLLVETIVEAIYEQNVLGVSRVRTNEETKEATVETPTGRISVGKAFVDTRDKRLLKYVSPSRK